MDREAGERGKENKEKSRPTNGTVEAEEVKQ